MSSPSRLPGGRVLLSGQPTGTGTPTPRGGPPPAPRPLTPAARQLYFSLASGPVGVVFVGLLLTCFSAILFVTLGVGGTVTDLLMDLQAVPVKARVERVETDFSTRLNRHFVQRVHITYVHEGRTYQGEFGTLNARVLAEAQPGAQLDVEVVPGSPTRARPVGDSSYFLGRWGLLWLGLLLSPLGLVALGVVRLRRQVHTFRNGELAWARVTSMGQDLSTRVNGRHPYVVRWEFDVAGQPYTGKLSTLTPPDLQTLLTGGPAPVLYLPGRPQHSVLYVD